MKLMILTRAALVGLLSISSVKAETLELDYSSLYSHTRKLDSETMPALQFAFGFQHQHQQRLCRIQQAFIHTQKQDIALDISPEQRFIIPSERALNLAKAVVKVELNEEVEHCDMSVQLETTKEFLKSDYTLQELRNIQRQYETFFDQMGSFMSFLMPSVEGISLQFKDIPTAAMTFNGELPLPSVTDNQLRLSNEWLQQRGASNLHLPILPMRIVAWVPAQ